MDKKFEKGIEDLEEKVSRPFQKFILIVLIPLLFALTVGLIVASLAGINIFQKAKNLGEKIPISGSLFQGQQNQSIQINRRNVAQLKSQLKERENEINKLQNELNSKESDFQKAQLDNSKLQQDISDLKTSQAQTKRNMKEIITTYETIEPKKAAPIIAKMSDTEALNILTSIKPEVLAAIMENMDPTQAARFTELMTNNNGDVNQSSNP